MDVITGLFFNQEGQVKDIVSILAEVNAQLEALAANFNLPAYVLFGAGIALAAILGLFGYRLIKLLMGVASAGAAYFVGVELFKLAEGALKLNLPTAVTYVAGAVCAVAMFFLAFRLFSYVLYVGMAGLGYFVVTFYVGSEHFIIALAGGIVLALLSMMFTRFVFVLLTSLVSSFAVVSMVSALLPDVKYVDLSQGIIPYVVAGTLACVFFFCQYLICRKLKKSAAAQARDKELTREQRAEKRAEKRAAKRAEKKALKKERLEQKRAEKERLKQLKAAQARRYQRQPMFLGFAD